MSTHTREWLTRKEAASYLISLGYILTPQTLGRLASEGKGPPYKLTLSHITAYSRQELEVWAKANTKEITAADLRKKRAKMESKRRTKGSAPHNTTACVGGALASAAKSSS